MKVWAVKNELLIANGLHGILGRPVALPAAVDKKIEYEKFHRCPKMVASRAAIKTKWKSSHATQRAATAKIACGEHGAHGAPVPVQDYNKGIEAFFGSNEDAGPSAKGRGCPRRCVTRIVRITMGRTVSSRSGVIGDNAVLPVVEVNFKDHVTSKLHRRRMVSPVLLI